MEYHISRGDKMVTKEMQKTVFPTRSVHSSEEFEKLKGDGSELVRIRFSAGGSGEVSQCIYYKANKRKSNKFANVNDKMAHNVIVTISCETQHIQFDADGCLILDSNEVKYGLVNPNNIEFHELYKNIQAAQKAQSAGL